jgi:putative flippase GtrA
MLLKLLDSERLRYLLAGAWNTAFGYSVGGGLYLLLSKQLHIVWISIIANILAISMSFCVNKLFVFRTRGHWLPEYLRSYVVYGGAAVVGTLLLWLLVDRMQVNIWWAQALILACMVLTSYLGHARFTFRRG